MMDVDVGIYKEKKYWFFYWENNMAIIDDDLASGQIIGPFTRQAHAELARDLFMLKGVAEPIAAA